MTSKAATTGAKYCVEAPRRSADGRPVVRTVSARDARAGHPEELEFADLHEIHDILDIKLRWYGWTWAKIGPFRPRGAKVLVDLIADGRVACRIAADRRTRAVQLSNEPAPAALRQRISGSAGGSLETDAAPRRFVNSSHLLPCR